jgi:hypothetical protein
MTRVQIFKRLDILMSVYHYSIANGLLSNGKRICITMERISLIRCAEKITEMPHSEPKPSYTIPTHLELTVQHIYNSYIK